MIDSKDFDFSFSGLKTAVLYHIRDTNLRRHPRLPIGGQANDTKKDVANVAASFEQAIVDVLVSKTAKALQRYNVKTLVVGGGVAANKKLRSYLEKLVTNHYPFVTLCLSPLWLTGDNAAMIAVAAYFRSLAKKKSASPDGTVGASWRTLRANGNLKL